MSTWFPHSGALPIPGVNEALPFVIIVIVKFVRGRTLPEHGAVVAGQLPFVPRPNRVALRGGIAVIAPSVGRITLNFVWQDAIINSLVGAILTLSLVVLTGFLGQISLM
jgi:branched-chain amino acid transport system permease protein